MERNDRPKCALITGITGQDGSYLAEFLLAQGYKVCGLVRRNSLGNYDRIAHILDEITLVPGDLLDLGSLVNAIRTVDPTEIYNLAAQSFVPASWQQPVVTGEITAIGVTRLLEAIRLAKPEARFYQASSSEMFGQAPDSPQSETTAFHARSPYGISKVYAHLIAKNYRESYGLFVCLGILFNHESPRRGLEFVTRKVSHAVARIRMGLQDRLAVGNLDARRDWGFAADYVRAMWLMLQQPEPDDYVIATGVSHSVRELVHLAFDCVGLGADDFLRADPSLYRPAEVDSLVGDSSKARTKLGWAPVVDFKELIQMMVEHDVYRVKNGIAPYRDVTTPVLATKP